MSCKGFVIAMRARVSQLPFDRPFLASDATDPGWLIVSRWGGRSEYLTISSAVQRGGGAETEETEAPGGLQPRRTWFGVLTPEQGARESMFLLNRQLPKDVPVAGNFAPAEGYVRLLTAEDGTLRLEAVGRELPEITIPVAGAQAWHVTAERRPWAGEFLDCSQG